MVIIIVRFKYASNLTLSDPAARSGDDIQPAFYWRSLPVIYVPPAVGVASRKVKAYGR